MMEKLLESAPLYQKNILSDHAPWYRSSLAKLPAITTYCLNCESIHTFNAISVNGSEPSDFEHVVGRPRYEVSNGAVYRLIYLCKMCNKFQKEFLVRFIVEKVEETDEEDEYTNVYALKVGQYPAPSIEVEKDIKNYLDEKNLELYTHGVISESQAYGVGAFAYYRQVIENQIDSLLDAVLKFAEDSKLEALKEKITEAKKHQDTTDKIEIVKDVLPAPLKPSGNNILKLIYSALSDGLHNKSDAECLEVSQNLRACLVFLVKKVEEQKRDEKEFTEAFNQLKTITKK